MDNLEFYEFTTFYYLSPTPERATNALQWVAATDDVVNEVSYLPVAYFLARLAQQNPELVQEYEALADEISDEGWIFLKSILWDFGSGKSGPVNILDRDIETSTDNDLLWAEFMFTGEKAPIERLIESLDQRDIVREKLEAWLRSPFASLLGGEKRKRRKCDQLLTVVGIACDPRLRRIKTVGDLDNMCLMQGLDLADAYRFAEIRKALPFKLSDSDVDYMGVKATAKWSLAGNANRHPLVLSTCEDELDHRNGSCRLTLLEIVEFARGNSENFALAMALRQKADAGNSQAQHDLGVMHYEGRGVHGDHELASYWFKKAADQGLADAQCKLADMFWNGQGVPEDEEAAEELAIKAASQGFAGAQLLLGLWQDGAEAADWLRKAAEQGLAKAQYHLGAVYWHGDGVEEDLAEAANWYRKAAEQGLAEAQYALGDVYRQGAGVEQDNDKAVFWFRRSADQGDEYAKYELDEMEAAGLISSEDGVG